MSHIRKGPPNSQDGNPGGGREYGASDSSDGPLDIRLSTPGSGAYRRHPEQLFAAAWSASLESAILAARHRKVVFPGSLAIEAEVDLCPAGGAYFVQARLNVSPPGMEREVAHALVDKEAPTMNDQYDLKRFVTAQDAVFDAVLKELKAARKQTHWMWFIFPSYAASAVPRQLRFTGSARLRKRAPIWAIRCWARA